MKTLLIGLSLLASISTFAETECSNGKYELTALQLTTRDFVPSGSIAVTKLPTAYAHGLGKDGKTLLVAHSENNIEMLKIAAKNNWSVCVKSASSYSEEVDPYTEGLIIRNAVILKH